MPELLGKAIRDVCNLINTDLFLLPV
jgi:hypothetical protein